jgi:transcriptional regulator
MYQPAHFREDRLDVQHALMRAHPFATLVTAGPGGLVATHLPVVLDPTGGPLGTLRAHVARGNGQWRDLGAVEEALVIFQGADAYITPSWYATKRETGKVVPTWNYAVVHAYGRPRAVHDADWLARHVGELTAIHEGGRPEPWRVGDAPAEFVRSLLKGIVGIEIAIARIEGKWKVSQNRPEADRHGVVAGLRGDGDAASAAMARLVEERAGPPAPAR